MLDFGKHQKNLSIKMLLLINAGIFVTVGSVSSRFHVLQVWLNLNYAEFSWLLLSFSCGQIFPVKKESGLFSNMIWIKRVVATGYEPET